jgi:hypothetical protein
VVALGEGATWRLSPRTERARARPTANVKAKSGSVVVRRRETVRLVGHPVLDLHALAYGCSSPLYSLTLVSTRTIDFKS